MNRRILLMSVAVLCAMATSAVAQESSVTGLVKDAQGQTMPGVTVTLTGPATSRVTTTDAGGNYRFDPVAPGAYKLRFELSGFRPLERGETAVTAGRPASVDVTMEIGLSETVNVTAQRREESLQSVPISITALTARDLELGGINDISRIQFQTPSLNLGRAGEDARPAMRGARTENIGPVNDAVIGFHIDGVYKTRFRQALNAFVDVERVEVQRGPQGTLFGRNTFGGNIHIITNSPGNQLDYGVDVTAGNYSRGKVEGFLNVPMGRRAQFRVAGSGERRDGYINNRGPGGDIWDEDLNYIRGSLRLLPTDNITILARGTHWDQGGSGQGDFGFVSLGTLRDATGRISLSGTRDPASTRRGSLGAELDSPFDINRDIPFVRDNKENLGTLEATWLAGKVQLKSVTSYTSFVSFVANDGDFSSNVHAYESFDEDLTSFTQEFQIASHGTSSFTWIVGAFHLQDDFAGRFIFDRLFQDRDTDGNPETASATTTIPGTPGFDTSNLESVETSSNAVFGQATFAVTEKLRATGGIRYTKDEKTYSSQNEITGLFARGFGGIEVRGLNNDWSKVTYKGGLDYQISPDHMVFGSVATGYVAGGFAFAAPTTIYNPQQVIAFEAGSKNQFGGRTRLNIAAYYADYTDLLANGYTTDPVSGAVFTYQTNAGAITSKGVELELETVPLKALNLRASLALQDAKYGSFVLPNPFPRGGNTIPGTNLINIEGTRVQQNPRARVSLSAGYDIDLKGFGVLTPHVQNYYSSEFTANDVVYGSDRVSVQDSYVKTDLRLSWAPRNRHFRAQAFVENLQNEAVLVRIVRGGDNFLQAGYAAPRTYGVKLTYRH